MTTETSNTPGRPHFASPVRIPNRFRAFWVPNCDGAYDDAPDYLWSDEAPSCALAASGDAPLTEAEWSTFTQEDLHFRGHHYLDFIKLRWPNLFRAFNRIAETARFLVSLEAMMQDSLKTYYENSHSRVRSLEKTFDEGGICFRVYFPHFKSFGRYLADIDQHRKWAQDRAGDTKGSEVSKPVATNTFEDAVFYRPPITFSLATLPDRLRNYLMFIREWRALIARRKALIESINSDWQREYATAKAAIAKADALFAELQNHGFTDTGWPTFDPSTRTDHGLGFHTPAASFFDVEPHHQHKHDAVPHLEMSPAAVSINRAADAIVKARHAVRELEGGTP